LLQNTCLQQYLYLKRFSRIVHVQILRCMFLALSRFQLSSIVRGFASSQSWTIFLHCERSSVAFPANHTRRAVVLVLLIRALLKLKSQTVVFCITCH